LKTLRFQGLFTVRILVRNFSRGSGRRKIVAQNR
jgi:hypothetical protein